MKIDYYSGKFYNKYNKPILSALTAESLHE